MTSCVAIVLLVVLWWYGSARAFRLLFQAIPRVYAIKSAVTLSCTLSLISLEREAKMLQIPPQALPQFICFRKDQDIKEKEWEWKLKVQEMEKQALVSMYEERIRAIKNKM